MNTPKISVVIPTKNRLEATSRSIKSVLEQSISPFEIIVIDDGSTDESSLKSKINFPEINLITNKVSLGGAVARNQGAEIAKGKYIAFLDSDDEWLPNHLESKLNVLNKFDAEGVYGTFYLLKGINRTNIYFVNKYSNDLNIGNAILCSDRYDTRTSTFLFKKEYFLKIKFDENLRKHQDWDLAMNFDDRYNFVLDNNPTVNIFVEQGEDRMSQKLQHESSYYFIKKNDKFLEPDNIFMFSLKQIMRSELAKESESIIRNYLDIIKPYSPSINLRNKFIYFLIRNRIINMGKIYSFISMFRN